MGIAKIKKRSVVLASIAVVVGLLLAFFAMAPGYIERGRNKIHAASAPASSAAAQALHAQLAVADLHADSLLWARDLSRRGTRGHLDIPRMVAGRMALATFSIVTKVPRGLAMSGNDDRSDDIRLLAIAQLWPPRTWFDLKQRTLYQIQKLQKVADRSQGKFKIVRTREELGDFLARRRFESDIAAGVIAVEGAHALNGDLKNLDELYRAGVRMMAPTHFFDNEIGGSAHGVKKRGLSVLGRQWVSAMEARHMLIDVAHASPQTIDDILAIAQRPVVVSHTGVRGTCNNERNLSDAQLRAIARSGGLVGIGFWETATCGKDVASIVRALRYTAKLIGVEHVALGSDFDGSVTVPFGADRMIELTGGLLAAGFAPNEIKLMMGNNVLRLLLEFLE